MLLCHVILPPSKVDRVRIPILCILSPYNLFWPMEN